MLVMAQPKGEGYDHRRRQTDPWGLIESVRCTAPGLFTRVAVKLDADNRIFTTLPVVRAANSQE